MTPDPTPKSGRFPFWPFALTLLSVLGLIGALNYAVDPLWFAHGNQLGSRNFAFNERIAKVNLLKRTVATAGYDCLILGSSRVTALRPSRFAGQRCFNLALKGAAAHEFLAYAKFASEQGLKPKTVYVSVDDFNFVDNKQTERRMNPVVKGSPNVFHAFWSVDVMTFSLLTLAGISPDPELYYDDRYEEQEFPHVAYAKPELVSKEKLACNPAPVKVYLAIREVFPGARVIGYAPPMTPWYKLSDVYSRGVLNCTLEAFSAVAAGYDEFWDFTMVSPLTTSAGVSYDGSHFSPDANDQVAQQLQGQRRDLALDAKHLPLADYQQQSRQQLKDFLAAQHREDFWQY